MQTDRQLLELAAKAAGISILGPTDKYIAQHEKGESAFIIDNDRGGNSNWNPLTDDGDALRLAVKLQLNIRHESWDVFVERVLRPEVSVGEGITMGYEREEATRRAIVRAAAEIGKEMA